MTDLRWRSTLAVTPYAVLGLLVATQLVLHWGAWAQLTPTFLLCLAYGAWVLVMRDLPLPWRDHPAAIAVFMIIAIGLNLALVLYDGVFGFLAIATFSFAYSIVSWPGELLAVAGTATVAGLAQSSGFTHDLVGIAATTAVVGLNVAVMCGTSFGLHRAEHSLQRRATENERTRLAREIHDTLAQGFTGIITQLQAAEQATSDIGRHHHTDAALALARDGLAEARRSVQALRPAALDKAPLSDALASVARTWAARSGIATTFTVSGATPTLTTETEVAVLRALQEAFANVERHAAARHAKVTLRTDATRTRLEVRDDGRGFDVIEQRERVDGATGGYGLVAMRERLASASGQVVIESLPGHGTVVRVEVPA